MARLSDLELASLVTATWPDGAVPQTGISKRATAYAIARAESGGRLEAVGDGGASFGPWQVYLPAHPNYSADYLMTADGAAAAALAISQGGETFNAWCTWESSACGGRGQSTYWQYLDEAGAALAAIGAGGSVDWPGVGPSLPALLPMGLSGDVGTLIGMAILGLGAWLIWGRGDNE